MADKSIQDMYRTYGPNKDNGGRTVYNHQRKRWLQSDDIEVVHYEVGEEDSLAFVHEEHIEGWGPTHMLMIVNARSNNRFFAVNLSSMTEEELDAFQKIMNDTVEAARATVQHRDKMAEEAAHGEERRIFQRMYRPTPVVVDLEGQER